MNTAYRHLPACDPTQPAWLTAKGAATHLGISPAYAGLLLKRGIIPGTQAVPGVCGGSIRRPLTRRSYVRRFVR